MMVMDIDVSSLVHAMDKKLIIVVGSIKSTVRAAAVRHFVFTLTDPKYNFCPHCFVENPGVMICQFRYADFGHSNILLLVLFSSH